MSPQWIRHSRVYAVQDGLFGRIGIDTLSVAPWLHLAFHAAPANSTTHPNVKAVAALQKAKQHEEKKDSYYFQHTLGPGMVE